MTDHNKDVDDRIFVSCKGRWLFLFSVLLLVSGYLVLWFNMIEIAPFMIIGAYILLGISLFI